MRTLYTEIAKFLEANPKYQSWKGLPPRYLDKIKQADAESVIYLDSSL